MCVGVPIAGDSAECQARLRVTTVCPSALPAQAAVVVRQAGPAHTVRATARPRAREHLNTISNRFSLKASSPVGDIYDDHHVCIMMDIIYTVKSNVDLQGESDEGEQGAGNPKPRTDPRCRSPAIPRAGLS